MVFAYNIRLPNHLDPTLDFLQKVAHSMPTPVGTSQISGRERVLNVEDLLTDFVATDVTPISRVQSSRKKQRA